MVWQDLVDGSTKRWLFFFSFLLFFLSRPRNGIQTGAAHHSVEIAVPDQPVTVLAPSDHKGERIFLEVADQIALAGREGHPADVAPPGCAKLSPGRVRPEGDFEGPAPHRLDRSDTD